MTVTPKSLASSLKLAARRRADTEEVGIGITLSEDGKRASFRVYNKDGGIMDVTVTEYKGPIG